MTARARWAGCGIASTRRRCGSCRGRRWRRPGMEIILGRWRIRGESSRLKPLLQKPRWEMRTGEREGDPCGRLLLGSAVAADRTSVVKVKDVSVCVDLGGSRNI